MRIAVMTFRLRASWVHSLKEKRKIVKSLIVKLQNKFHVSAAETDEQNTHQIIVISLSQRNVAGTVTEKPVCKCFANQHKKEKIPELYDNIAIVNPGINLFIQCGFQEEYRTNEIIMLKKSL